MLLNGDDIKKKNLVENASVGSYRAASYDLRVGKIMTGSGEEVTTFVLKPQGMVLVISKERLKLPKTIAGYATVKTALCHDGVLATNIGILDPGYEGLASSYLINFGKTDFALAVEQPFLRLAFHEFTAWADAPPAPSRQDADYVNDRRHEVVKSMPETFLDLTTNVKKIADDVLAQWRTRILIFVGVIAAFVTVITWGVTLGVTYSGREVPSKEQLKAELAAEIQARSLKNVDEQLAKINERLVKVEQIASPSAQPTAKPSAQQGKNPSSPQPPGSPKP
jgi:deoxycytidine triphosphate deaminase